MSYDAEGNYILDPQDVLSEGESVMIESDFDEYYDPDEEWEGAGFSILAELVEDEEDISEWVNEEGEWVSDE